MTTTTLLDLGGLAVAQKPIELNIVEVYSQICAGLDRQIFICLFLVLTFYTVTKVVMPLSLKGIAETFPFIEPLIRDPYRWLEDILDGLCIMSMSYVVVLLWMGDKLTSGFKTWFIVLIALVILAVVPKFIAWWRGGRKSSTLEMVKKGFKNLQEEGK